MKRNTPQLTLSVTQKDRSTVLPFVDRFGGYLYYDRAQNGYWKWMLFHREALPPFLEYARSCPIRSYRRQRLFLVPSYLELVALKAYRAEPTSALGKRWTAWVRRWG
jgi:ubiquinol-cytochrome c reductase cytochrome b subunit